VYPIKPPPEGAGVIMVPSSAVIKYWLSEERLFKKRTEKIEKYKQSLTFASHCKIGPRDRRPSYLSEVLIQNQGICNGLFGHDVIVRRGRCVVLKNGTLERKERFEERLETF
jgi:hypothetical protein